MMDISSSKRIDFMYMACSDSQTETSALKEVPATETFPDVKVDEEKLTFKERITCFFHYAKEAVETMPVLASEAKCSTLRMYISFLSHYCSYHVTLEDFKQFHLYNLSTIGAKDVLTSRRRYRTMKKVNKGSRPEDFDIFNQKHLFNKAFKDYVQRPWLYAETASDAELRDFFSATERFIVKPAGGCQGIGIEFYQTGAYDAEELIKRYIGKPILFEAFIKQHPKMDELNPTSVNTVRVVAVKKGCKAILLGAGLRCGGNGCFVDNYHNGGSAYPLDLDSGIVVGPGKMDGAETELIRNPATGIIMPGFQVPHWDILKDKVLAATLESERIGYIAWDIAITEDGVDFVEGNVQNPGYTVIQLGGRGVNRRLQKFVYGH